MDEVLKVKGEAMIVSLFSKLQKANDDHDATDKSKDMPADIWRTSQVRNPETKYAPCVFQRNWPQTLSIA